jgi:hypothetical protein
MVAKERAQNEARERLMKERQADDY